MSDLPFLPLWVAKYEARTAHLTLEEDGAYTRLLRLSWVTPKCQIPADDAWIKRMMRVDEATYTRVVRPILDEFFYKAEGAWRNQRLRDEWSTRSKTAKKLSEAGKIGGQNSARKRKEKPSSEAAAGLQHEEKPGSSMPESRIHSQKACKQALVDQIRKVLGPGLSSEVDDANIEAAANDWLDLGATDAEIVEVVRRQTANRRPKPLRSLRALTGDVQAAIDQRGATSAKAPPKPLEPLVIPEGKAGVCVAEIIAHYGQERATAWLSGAEWTETELLLPSEFERARVEQGFGMILDGFGFTAGVGRSRRSA